MAARRAFFDLRAGEGRGVLLGFLGLLGITSAHTLIETSRDALFLAKVPTTHLPALYITIAVLGIFTSRARTKKKNDDDDDAGKASSIFSDPVALTMLGAAVITLGFWALAARPTRYVLYALYVFSGMFAAQVAGQLWLRLGSIFAEHAKRLFGLIGTGAVLGAVLGSAVARGLLSIIHVRHLLLVAVIVLIATGLGPARLLKEPAAAPRARSASDDDDESSSSKGKQSLADEALAVTRHPYLVRLLLLTLLAASAGTAIDFLFKRQLAATLTPAELGPFLATVSLITNLASLMAQTIGVGLAIRVLDVHRALYVMPLLLALGATGTVLGVGVAVLLLRGFDGSLRHSLHKTTTELLFVPLPDSLRARAKPIIDLIGQRGGQAVVSIAILVLVTFLPRHVELAVGGAVLGLVIAWLAVVMGIRSRYLDVFRETLRRGRADLAGTDLPPLDMGALEALIAALSSRKDAEVLGALDLLAAQGRARLIPSLVLFHPKKPIVLRALEVMVESGRTDFVDVADRLLVDHSDAEVRAAALRARSAVSPDAEFLEECLTNGSHEEIRATALVALIATGGIERAAAKEILDTLLAPGADPVAQAALARAMGEVHGEPTGEARTLIEDALIALTEGRRGTKLLAAAETDTLVHVTHAMARMKSPPFGPLLFEMVRERSPAGLAAVEALGLMGGVTIDLLDAALDREDEAVETKWRVINALARSTSPKAVTILVERLSLASTDTALRSRILRALRGKQSAGIAIPIAKSDLIALAEGTVAAIARALAARLCHARLLEQEKKEGRQAAVLDTAAGAELIQRLLRDKEIEGTDRLFLILSLLYPAERFQRIQRGLESPNAKSRASARELLTNILVAPLRAPVLAIVDDVTDEERLRLIGEERKETRYEEILTAMIAWGSELGALAMFHSAELGLAPQEKAIEAAMEKMDASGAELARGLSARDLSKGIAATSSSGSLPVVRAAEEEVVS